MRTIISVDTYYPYALAGLFTQHPEWKGMPYAYHLAGLLHESFGTADFWTRNLGPIGWEAVDVVANAADLQAKWYRERNGGADAPSSWAVVDAQVEALDADVVLLQDVGAAPIHLLDRWRGQGRLLAAQCSCPMPDHENLRRLDVCFTSFPHYAGSDGELARCGVRRVEFLPLAFEPDVLRRMRTARMLGLGDGAIVPVLGEIVAEMDSIAGRDIPVAFVGGVGKRVHWRAGTEALEAVASRFGPENFHWYGYGREYLEVGSPLFRCWRGEAWGLDMYRVYQRARVVVNRHGEVARGMTNNMRCFEVPSLGAVLMTEESPNLTELFPHGGVVGYTSPGNLCESIGVLLGDEQTRASIADIGARTVLEHHTFARRMERVSEVLGEELAKRSSK